MKFREGFVSNSSSSSFIMLAFKNDGWKCSELMSEIASKDGKIEDYGYASLIGSRFIYTNEGECSPSKNIQEWTKHGCPHYLGLPQKETLQILEKYNLPQAREFLKQEILRLTGVDVHISNIDLCYGTEGGG